MLRVDGVRSSVEGSCGTAYAPSVPRCGCVSVYGALVSVLARILVSAVVAQPCGAYTAPPHTSCRAKACKAGLLNLRRAHA